MQWLIAHSFLNDPFAIDCLYIILSETDLALTLEGRERLQPVIQNVLDFSEPGFIPSIILEFITSSYKNAGFALDHAEITAKYGLDNCYKIIYQDRGLGFYDECRFETLRETALHGRFNFFNVSVADQEPNVATVIKPGVLL